MCLKAKQLPFSIREQFTGKYRIGNFLHSMSCHLNFADWHLAFSVIERFQGLVTAPRVAKGRRRQERAADLRHMGGPRIFFCASSFTWPWLDPVAQARCSSGKFELCVINGSSICGPIGSPCVSGSAGAGGSLTCLKAGCNKPTWNGQPNEYCGKSHRAEDTAARCCGRVQRGPLGPKIRDNYTT